MNDENRMIGSCMSYAKLGKAISEEFGIRSWRSYGGGGRLDELMRLIRLVVREEARRAAEEAALRALCLAADHLPDEPEDGLLVPATELRINEGGVGRIKTQPFNSITRRGFA